MNVFVADVVKKAMEQGRIAHPGVIGSVYFAAARGHYLNLDTDDYLDQLVEDSQDILRTVWK